MNYTAVSLIAVGLMIAPVASAQQGSKPASAPKVTAAAPVPRTVFIQTMDGEFGKMDADKDKLLTKAEIEQFQRAVSQLEAQARARELFARLDADRNGQLSIAEFGQTVAAAPPNAAPVLGHADLNRDGRITLVEYRTAKLANFDRMDADKDGVVSVPELKAAGLAK